MKQNLTQEQFMAISAYDRYIQTHPDLSQKQIEYIERIQFAISKKRGRIK